MQRRGLASAIQGFAAIHDARAQEDQQLVARVTILRGAEQDAEHRDVREERDAVEACAYLRNELDKVTGQLRRAFSDTEARLEQEQAELRERLRGC